MEQRRRNRCAQIRVAFEDAAGPCVLARWNHHTAAGHILVDRKRALRPILLSFEQVTKARARARLNIEEVPVARGTLELILEIREGREIGVWLNPPDPRPALRLVTQVKTALERAVTAPTKEAHFGIKVVSDLRVAPACCERRVGVGIRGSSGVIGATTTLGRVSARKEGEHTSVRGRLPPKIHSVSAVVILGRGVFADPL